jgi:tetratricopeptide (TPR) repeat protein
MNAHLQHASLLVAHRRFAEAEKEIAAALALEPDHPLAHVLLARCLVGREQYDQAMGHAQQAVGLAPDWPAAHFVLATVWLAKNDPKKAEAAARETLTLDPHDADNQLLLGRIQFLQCRWEEALASAETALGIDPEHQGALNLRAECLRKLGRTGPAESQLRGALAVDAENAQTHANLGWLSLQLGNRQPASEHFREALRLDPELESARSGVVESLKAWNPVYRLFLKYVFQMQRLGLRARWMVVLGAWLFYMIASQIAAAMPRLARLIWPLMGAYLMLVLLTWLAVPLANLALQLHPFGRLALSRDERRASNWIGGFLLAALVAGIGYLIQPNVVARDAGLFCGLMVLPLTATFSAQWQRPRRMMAIYTLLVGLLGFYVFGLDLLRALDLLPGLLRAFCPVWLAWPLAVLYPLCVAGFVLGTAFSLVAGNILMSIRWQRKSARNGLLF